MKNVEDLIPFIVVVLILFVIGDIVTTQLVNMSGVSWQEGNSGTNTLLEQHPNDWYLYSLRDKMVFLTFFVLMGLIASCIFICFGITKPKTAIYTCYGFIVLGFYITLSNLFFLTTSVVIGKGYSLIPFEPFQSIIASTVFDILFITFFILIGVVFDTGIVDEFKRMIRNGFNKKI